MASHSHGKLEALRRSPFKIKASTPTLSHLRLTVEPWRLIVKTRLGAMEAQAGALADQHGASPKVVEAQLSTMESHVGATQARPSDV